MKFTYLNWWEDLSKQNASEELKSFNGLPSIHSWMESYVQQLLESFIDEIVEFDITAVISWTNNHTCFQQLCNIISQIQPLKAISLLIVQKLKKSSAVLWAITLSETHQIILVLVCTYILTHTHAHTHMYVCKILKSNKTSGRMRILLLCSNYEF